VLDPEKIAKKRKTSQKGASRSSKPKKFYVCLQEKIISKNIRFEDIEPSIVSKEIPAKIHNTPCSFTSPLDSSPKKASHTIHHIPLSLSSISLLPTIQSTSILQPILVMAGQQAPTKMERIIAARYGPLVLPIPLKSMPAREYQKYMTKFTGTEGVTAEEHLESFYSYVDNLDTSEDDVWMRVFVQSLDGEARKWFRELTPQSIVDIKALDDVFLKHWGDKKELLYYHTKFGNLKRENGESFPDFNKRFNRMYSKILAEVKPTPTSTKLTYANAFDSDFFLLLRERRCATLAKMKDAALDVESNIMAAEKLEIHADRRRQRGEASSSSTSSSEPKLDKMTKMIESLAVEISKMKVEKSFGKARLPNTFAPRNPNPFKRENE